MAYRSVSGFIALVLLSASATPSAWAGVSDLNISFCGPDGQSLKRLDLTIDQAPWHGTACIRYSNLGTELTGVSIGASDGFMLADGKIGCADASADSGAFAGLVRYEGGETSFSLAPGESADRTVVFDVPSTSSGSIFGCLITAPLASASSSGGIDVVVRRANVVTLSPSISPTTSVPAVSESATVPNPESLSVGSQTAASTGSSNTGSSSTGASVLPPASASSPSVSDVPVVKDQAPARLSFLASAREGSVPTWLAVALGLAGFVAGLLVFRLPLFSRKRNDSDIE